MTPELRADLQTLDEFLRDIRQAVGKGLGESSITNVNTTNVVASTQVIAGTGLVGGGPLTSDVTLAIDTSLVVTGSGTTDRLTKWGGSGLTDSHLAEGATSGFVAILDTSLLANNDTFYLQNPRALAGYIVTGGGSPDAVPVFAGNGSEIVGSGILWQAGSGTPVFYTTAATVTFQNSAGATMSIGDVSGGGAGNGYLTIAVSSSGVTLDSVAGTTPSFTFNDTIIGNHATNAFNAGTSGRFSSNVTDGAGKKTFKFQSTNALTSGLDRWYFSFEDSSGNQLMSLRADGSWEIGGVGASGGYLTVGSTRTTESIGVYFIPTINTSGTGTPGTSWNNSCIGGFFSQKDHASATYDTMIGAVIAPQSLVGRAHARIIGMFVPFPLPPATTATYGDYWGSYYQNTGTHAGATVRTISNIAANYVTLLAPSATSKPLIVNNYGLAYVEEQKNGTTINTGLFFANATAGYKAITVRDQNTWIGSDAAAELTIGGTNCRIITTNIGFFGVAAVARPGVFTQTYATSSHTHANPTAVTLTDNTTGTANTTLEALTSGVVYATDVAAIRNNFADLAAAVNALVADLANVKQVLNASIDDSQLLGLKA